MANLYQFSLDRAVDGSGVPLSGAKLNVYATGTTTPATYWTDAAGATAGGNPQTSDANGRFAPVFLDPGKRYRIKVTDSAGTTTLYDVDPVRGSDEGSVGGALMLESRAAGIARSIPADVNAVTTGGYAAKGDRGQALYARKTSSPGTAPGYTTTAWFQSADGAYWELSENELNPFMFGAKGDNSTNDSPAIQAMFTYVEAKGRPYPIQFLGAKYYVADSILLPKLPLFLAIDIAGGGATLRTDQAIKIFQRVPANQSQADIWMDYSHYDIHHLEFIGTELAGQVGIHIGATYTNVVRHCVFRELGYGTIGTFCLASAWRDNLYYKCKKRGAVVESGVGSDNGIVWTGALETNSASNVSVFENCRVLGHAEHTSSFGIFASDAVRMNGCISEGPGANYDVEFDYQGSSTVKQFHVHMFHAEAQFQKVNFRIRATGIVVIDGLIRSMAAPICDARNSSSCEFHFKNIAWLADMPVPTGTGANPNGRWFYHSNGNGYGAVTEAGNSAGVSWRFENCSSNAWLLLKDPAKWENATLPNYLHVRGWTVDGMAEWSNGGSVFKGIVAFADNTNISGMKKGLVVSTTTSVPANSSVTETFTVTGLIALKHVATINPQYGYIPPAGMVWTGWVHNNDTLKIQYTNPTGSAMTLPTNMTWDYAAVRSY
jgi:hypothetical protein